MREREPQKEIVGRGQLWYLHHPGTEEIFSGYGLTIEPNQQNRLAGVLMVDRPYRADPDWLQTIYDTYGECQLVSMTATGERGLVCRMQIEQDSLSHLRPFPSAMSDAIQKALEPLREDPPAPKLRLRWDEERRLWKSEFAGVNEMPAEIREVFEETGYGCLSAETNIGVVHVCHAADSDIEGFANKPVRSQWQLIKMPNAPLIRLELVIFDRPDYPYRFESFLNVAAEDQARILAQLAGQDQLYLAFYDDKLDYHHAFLWRGADAAPGH